MKKILLITSSFKDQDSIASIVRNIILTFQQFTHLKITLEAIESFTARPEEHDWVVIVHPLAILSSNIQYICSRSRRIIFFIFGDYVRKSSFYIRLEENLMDKEVLFFTASHSYSELLAKTIVTTQSIKVVPFALNFKIFNSKSSRTEFRLKHSFKENDFVLLYTGRISPQKNILSLIQSFFKLKAVQPNCKLVLIGNIDDFESPTFYERQWRPGEFFQALSKTLENSDEIIFLPRVSHSELRKAYAGTDLFVSLSTYHDEDFGYSPIEALSSGLPTLISSWGGYRDLQYSHFIKIGEENKRAHIQEEEFLLKLSECIFLKRIPMKERRQVRRKYDSYTIAQSYKLFIDQKLEKFKGFNELFKVFALQQVFNEIDATSQYSYLYNSFWGTNSQLKMPHCFNPQKDIKNAEAFLHLKYETGLTASEVTNWEFYSQSSRSPKTQTLVYLADFSEKSLECLRENHLPNRFYYFIHTQAGNFKQEILHYLQSGASLNFARLFKKASLANWSVQLISANNVDCVIINEFLALGASLIQKNLYQEREIVKKHPLSLQHGVLFYRVKS